MDIFVTAALTFVLLLLLRMLIDFCYSYFQYRGCGKSSDVTENGSGPHREIFFIDIQDSSVILEELPTYEHLETLEGLPPTYEEALNLPSPSTEEHHAYRTVS